MLNALVIKELQNYVLGFRFLFTLLVVTGLALLSASIRIDDYAQSLADYHANQSAWEEGLQDRRWWRFQQFGTVVQRPVQPLQVVVAGAESGAETRAQIFSKREPLIRLRGTLDQNPLLRLFQPVDFMYITGVVMSLLVLVLSFDSVSGEREEGTLKLLLSYPVPRATFMFAKWIGGVLTLALAFSVAYLGVALWLLVSPEIGLRQSDWWAFFFIGLASLLFISWMFSASLLISSVCRQSASSMCLLLLAWVLLVLVVPNLVPFAAAAISPAESRSSVEFKTMETTERLRDEERQQLRAIARNYDARRWWQHPDAREEGLDLTAQYHDTIRRQTREIADTRYAQLASQEEWAGILGRVSPFVLYTRITSHLAWTGLSFERDWRRQLRRYEDDLRTVVTTGMSEDWPFEPERIPVFRYEPPPLGTRFMERLPEWILLAAGSVVFFLAAAVRVFVMDLTE